MIVIVTGSRIWPARYVVWRALAAEAPELVVHGGCDEGADYMAEAWCRDHEVDSRIVRARWRRDTGGKPDMSAGHRRNARMLALYPEAHVLAFPYGKAAGTRGCIAEAQRRRMRVTIIDPTGAVSLPPPPSEDDE